jgi:hypothetical protein
MSIDEGDVVNFYSGYWAFQMEYAHRNPGIVIKTKKPKGAHRGSATVLWSNGTISTEHASYLEPAYE